MEKKCLRSRGNVAIAALMFVSMVGVGAIALNSARVPTRSQLAQAPAAAPVKAPTTPAKPDPGHKEQACELGYDYVVRYDDKTKEPTIKPTFGPTVGAPKDIKGIDNKAAGNQCQNPSSPPAGRVCTAEGWKCKVYFCIPAKVTAKGEQEDCQLRGFEGTVNKAFVDASTYKSYVGAQIADILKNTDDPARIASISSEAKKLDNGLSSSIFDSLGGAKRATEIESEIYKSQQEVERLRALSKEVCAQSMGLGSGCAELSAKEVDEKRRLAELTNQSKALAALQGSVAPTTMPNTMPPPNTTPPPNTMPPPNTTPPPNTFTPSPSSQTPSTNSSGGMGDIMKSLGQAMPLISALAGALGGGQSVPTCSLQASPANITTAGQPVTLSWSTQGAQSANLSNVGQVGPSGSMTVNPQQTTTYSMQVIGYPPQQQQQQQSYNPYTGAYGGTQGQYVWNPQLGAYVYTQAQQQQNPYGQIGQTIGQLFNGGSSGPQQGQCQTQVTVGSNTNTSTGTGQPKAQISCQPKIADVGMAVSISYACQNGAVTSKGEGFSTDNNLSGSASTTVASPSLGSTSITYGLTCSKDGVTDSAQCTVNVNKPSIVLVANPKSIDDGDQTTIGWVTGAMESCVISSPDNSRFTEDNKGNTSISGSAKTPRLTRDTRFVLTCTTKAGGTKTAEALVSVDD